MSKIPVKTITSSRSALNHLTRLMKSVHAEIRTCALRRFGENRKGHELEDWMAAERDVLYSPACVLAECPGEIRLQAAVPCVDPKSLLVDVMPQSITIEGRMRKAKARPDEKIHLREFGGMRLLRQLDLPARIEPEHAKATLENGVLEVIARKAELAPTVDGVEVSKHAAA